MASHVTETSTGGYQLRHAREPTVSTAADGTSFETADAAMRSANFDVKSKLLSFSIPCNDESI